MLEVVFSDSIKGSMRVAKRFEKENMLGGSIAYIGTPPSKEEYEKMFEGEAIGGDTADVIGIQFHLDIGDISGEADGKKRRDLFFEMFKSPFENDDDAQLEQSWKTNKDDLERLRKSAADGEAIRIWWSDAPYEACGFYETISVLKDFDCEVSSIKLPKYKVQTDGSVQFYTSWCEIHPGKFYQFLPDEKKIKKPIRRTIALEWTELKRENAPLRAVINGKLTSVPKDFYDFLIRANIPDGNFVMGRLIGWIMGNYQLGVGDWWYAQRIKKMIETKEIDIISDNKFEYQKVLKKHTAD